MTIKEVSIPGMIANCLREAFDDVLYDSRTEVITIQVGGASHYAYVRRREVNPWAETHGVKAVVESKASEIGRSMIREIFRSHCESIDDKKMIFESNNGSTAVVTVVDNTQFFGEDYK